jgi:hypothetical protein
MAVPWILATVGLGSVPLRSPLAVEDMVAALPKPRLVLAVVALLRSLRSLVFCSDPATVTLLEIIPFTLDVAARVGEVALVLVPARSPANSMRPGVVVVALLTVPLLVTVAQLVALELVAWST